MDIILFIAGIFIAILMWWFTKELFVENIKVLYKKKRHKIITKATPENIQNWLINYYIDKNQDTYLYKTGSTKEPILIPMLTKPEWGLKDRELNSIYYFPDNPIYISIKINNTIINRRKKLFGQRLWNQEIFIANKLFDSDDGICVEVGYSDYYQFLSSCGILADEMIFSIYSQKDTTYRDKMASDIDLLETFPCKSHIMGIHSIVIGKKNNGDYSLILHKRSEEVAINYGAFTGVPTFVFQPHSGYEEYDKNILYSFFREYLEELYNKEELVRDKIDISRANPTWLYKEREINEIIKRLNNNKAEFHIFGFGFDLNNCDFITCVCLIINDSLFWEDETCVMEKNWEAEKNMFRQEYLLFSQEIDNLIIKRSIQPGTVYCIDKARKLLNDRNT